MAQQPREYLRWDLLDRDKDPVPWDPSEARSLRDFYEKLADAAETAGREVRRLDRGSLGEGRTVEVLQELVEELPKYLDKAHDAYEAGYRALETWAEALETARTNSAAVARVASTAYHGLEDTDEWSQGDDPLRRSHINDLDAVLTEMDRIADDTKRALEDAKQGSPRKLWGWLDKIVTWIEDNPLIYAAVMIVAGLAAIFIPGLGIALAIAALSLATANLYREGKLGFNLETIATLGIEALALVPGGALLRGASALGRVARPVGGLMARGIRSSAAGVRLATGAQRIGSRVGGMRSGYQALRSSRTSVNVAHSVARDTTSGMAASLATQIAADPENWKCYLSPGSLANEALGAFATNALGSGVGAYRENHGLGPLGGGPDGPSTGDDLTIPTGDGDVTVSRSDGTTTISASDGLTVQGSTGDGEPVQITQSGTVDLDFGDGGPTVSRPEPDGTGTAPDTRVVDPAGGTSTDIGESGYRVSTDGGSTQGYDRGTDTATISSGDVRVDAGPGFVRVVDEAQGVDIAQRADGSADGRGAGSTAVLPSGGGAEIRTGNPTLSPSAAMDSDGHVRIDGDGGIRGSDAWPGQVRTEDGTGVAVLQRGGEDRIQVWDADGTRRSYDMNGDPVPAGAHPPLRTNAQGEPYLLTGGTRVEVGRGPDASPALRMDTPQGWTVTTSRDGAVDLAAPSNGGGDRLQATRRPDGTTALGTDTHRVGTGPDGLSARGPGDVRAGSDRDGSHVSDGTVRTDVRRGESSGLGSAETTRTDAPDRPLAAQGDGEGRVTTSDGTTVRTRSDEVTAAVPTDGGPRTIRSGDRTIDAGPDGIGLRGPSPDSPGTVPLRMGETAGDAGRVPPGWRVTADSDGGMTAATHPDHRTEVPAPRPEPIRAAGREIAWQLTKNVLNLSFGFAVDSSRESARELLGELGIEAEWLTAFATDTDDPKYWVQVGAQLVTAVPKAGVEGRLAHDGELPGAFGAGLVMESAHQAARNNLRDGVMGELEEHEKEEQRAAETLERRREDVRARLEALDMMFDQGMVDEFIRDHPNPTAPERERVAAVVAAAVDERDRLLGELAELEKTG